jgi:hypothetical protein
MKLMQMIEDYITHRPLVNALTKHQHLALTTFAHVFDTIGLEASEMDILGKDFGRNILKIMHSNTIYDVYWVASIELNECCSTWEVKLSYRQSPNFKTVRFYRNVYNQMCCRGTQIHRLVADIARMDKYLTLVSKAIPLAGDDGFALYRNNSSMFDALLSIYSDLMTLEHNEFPTIAACDEEDSVVIKYPNCWFRLTADSGPWDNSKHIVQIYDDRGGNISFDTSYNDKHKALIQAVLHANNIVSPIDDSTTSLWQVPENLWVEQEQEHEQDNRA